MLNVIPMYIYKFSITLELSRISDPLRPVQVLGLLQLLGPRHVAPDAEQTGVTHKQEVDHHREQQRHSHGQASDPGNTSE